LVTWNVVAPAAMDAGSGRHPDSKSVTETVRAPALAEVSVALLLLHAARPSTVAVRTTEPGRCLAVGRRVGNGLTAFLG
jgi:hypothetical protein